MTAFNRKTWRESAISRGRGKWKSWCKNASVGGGCRVEKDGVVGEKVVKTLVRLWSPFTDHVEGLGM